MIACIKLCFVCASLAIDVVCIVNGTMFCANAVT